jgi:hypothetical protein
MVSCHLPSFVSKIVAFYLHVTIHVQWNQKMNLYIVDFSFIQYPLQFVTMVTCDLTFVIRKNLVVYVTCN